MSDAEKDDAEALDAVHSWELFMRLLERRDPDRPKVTAEEIAAKPDQTWPIVRRHPVTGAKSVYVNPKNTRAVVRRDSGVRLAPETTRLASQQTAAITPAVNQSCQNPRHGKRASIASIAIIASDHSRIALPKGCPLNRSSKAPSGAPAQSGSRPGRTIRQPSSIRKPKEGSSGMVSAISSTGRAEASMIEA